jgi:hypothetical protein
MTGSTASLRGKRTSRIAKAMQPATRMATPRLVRSAGRPPEGTEKGGQLSHVQAVNSTSAAGARLNPARVLRFASWDIGEQPAVAVVPI